MIMLCAIIFLLKTGASQDIRKPVLMQTARLGDSVIIECNLTKEKGTLYWYKQIIVEMPQWIVRSVQTAVRWNPAFDNSRFTVSADGKTFHLSIASTKQEDGGTYYCGKMQSTAKFVEFESGTFLMLTGVESSSETVLKQPVSESVQPGDDVTLQCTILTESCAGEHGVYWFRHRSGESHPGIIYTHGGRSDQCEKSPEAGSPTQSCVYYLPKRNLSLSDAGTYYCAVATCGEILFGNGTRLSIEENGTQMVLNPAVLTLAISNIFSVVVIAILVVQLYKYRSRGSSNDQTIQVNQVEDTENVNYAVFPVSRLPLEEPEESPAEMMLCTPRSNYHSRSGNYGV